MVPNVYLFFEDSCREAFEHYREVFRGEYEIMQTYRDAPVDLGVPEDEKDRIMHITLKVGDGIIMGSDSNSAMGGPALRGDNFAVSVPVESKAECERIFVALAEGGTVKMPLDKMFWGAIFGCCQDRFGINWMFNCPAD